MANIPTKTGRTERGVMKLLLYVILGCASYVVLAEDDFDDPDPWIGVNQSIHGFNDVVDAKLLRPTAVGYRKVVPPFIRQRVSNVFGNLGDVSDLVNNLLQGKVGPAMQDSWRILINSSVGLGGLFDPATALDLPDHDEDFGQTLGTWGIGSGPYLVLPFLGPSTVRDGIARVADGRLKPQRYLHPVSHRNGIYGLDVIHTRSELLSAEGAIFGDRYTFLREAYLQRRNYLIHDGETDDAFADDF